MVHEPENTEASFGKLFVAENIHENVCANTRQPPYFFGWLFSLVLMTQDFCLEAASANAGRAQIFFSLVKSVLINKKKKSMCGY